VTLDPVFWREQLAFSVAGDLRVFTSESSGAGKEYGNP
jgi:hypothetical protein